MLLQGCGSLQLSSETESHQDAPEIATYQTQEGLSSSERFREALNMLQRGYLVPARAELVRYLQEKPGSAVAVSLLAQIDTPSHEYFPSDYREVRLAQGQSLSTLSKHYLGSIYKFHALAKYNGIAEPNSLIVGQKVKIPLTPGALAAFAKDQDEPKIVEVTVPEDSAEDEAGSTAEEGELGETEYIELPEQASEFSPNTQPDLEETDVDADKPTDIVEPVEEFIPVNDVSDPVPTISQEVEQLHREALDAYRAHKLELAIELWDQVLIYDENHKNARLYRADAIRLQKLLKAQKDNQKNNQKKKKTS